MAATLVSSRRTFNHVAALYVGVSSTVYNYVGEASGIDRVSWTMRSPYVEIPVPFAEESIWQQSRPPTVEGTLSLHDREAVLQLLQTIDVDNTAAGTQTAILSTGFRTMIDYFRIIAKETRIVNATDGRTIVVTTAMFTNVRIQDVKVDWNEPKAPVEIRFTAKTVSEVTV